MQKINLAFLILATFCIAKCLSKPTFRDHEFEDGATFRDVLKQVSDDTVMAAKSKTAVLQFLGESTVNAALEGIDIGVDFARNIDVEDRINKTEQAILDAKLAKIESIFELKRKALRTMNTVLESSIEGINAALASLNSAISMSSSFILTLSGNGNVTSDLNTSGPNADNPDLNPDMDPESGNSLLNALFNITGSVQATGTNVLENLVESKLQLQEAINNFSSQSAFQGMNSNLNFGVNATIDNVLSAGNYLGVFNALDNIVQGTVGLPIKIKNFVSNVNDDEEL